MGGAGSRWEGPREGLGRPPQIGSVGRGLALGKGKRATGAGGREHGSRRRVPIRSLGLGV